VSADPSYSLHGFWGARAESVETLTDRILGSFDALRSAGAALAGPWTSDVERENDVTDREAIRAHVEASPERDTTGEPVGGDRFSPVFRLGDFTAPQSAATDIASLDIRTSPFASVRGTPVSSVVLTAQGSVAEALRDNAGPLVEAFARAWQPEYLAVTDDELLARRGERRPGPGRPSWGYVAWLSDAVSRQLDTVDGARTSRFGAGTLLVIDEWHAASATHVWASLLDTKRLRAAPAVQDVPPTFP